MGISYPGRARINPANPEALGICGRCRFQYNLSDLRYQDRWAGTRIIVTSLRVCDTCYDPPNEQFRSIRLPPDPVSVNDPRPEDFSALEKNFLNITKVIGWDYMFGFNQSSMQADLDHRPGIRDADFDVVSGMDGDLQYDAVMSPAFSDTSDVSMTLQRGISTSPAFSDTSDVSATLTQAVGGFSFNMTAGDFISAVQGYSDGSIISAFGSIDAEPISGETLVALYDLSSDGSGAIGFAGDITSIVSGLSIYVDSVEYPFDTDWAYNGGDDITEGVWDPGNAPDFVDTTMYFVEIK